jgi:hypothetical protein
MDLLLLVLLGCLERSLGGDKSGEVRDEVARMGYIGVDLDWLSVST